MIKHPPYWEQGLPSHLPFCNATEAMVAWELFEISHHRLRLFDVEQSVIDALASEEDARQAFRTMLGAMLASSFSEILFKVESARD